jgi:formylglycine-generating enzyme required for sulfatase activity
MAISPPLLSLHHYKRTHKSYGEDLGDGVKLTLMQIPAGEFLMGAPEDEPDSRDNERPQHLVKLAQFYMGRFPVTQAQWRVVAGYEPVDLRLDPNPSNFKGGDSTTEHRPVEKVSWEDAQEFCQRLSKKTGRDYRLPSEAQWEYACRAGTTTPFHFGETILPELANYRTDIEYNGRMKYDGGSTDQHRGETIAVGSFLANDWGLCDMHGNVLEWCEDDWHGSYKGAPIDGSAWLENDQKTAEKLLRGGSWIDFPRHCRSACRFCDSRDGRDFIVGFRVCCVPPRLSS